MDELTKENIIIEDMIYEIRGKQVMLDSDLAKLYHVETKRINEAVKRNIERFPEDFCFQLSKDDMQNLRSQFATSSVKDIQYGGRRYLPYVFNEQGVAMLSAVLKSNVAIETSIKIMNAFVAMRKYLSNNVNKFSFFENQVLKNVEEIKENRSRISALEESFKKFEEKKVVNEIYFNGQIYDAYSKIIDIFREAKK